MPLRGLFSQRAILFFLLYTLFYSLLNENLFLDIQFILLKMDSLAWIMTGKQER